jgi:hypothetical protein
MTDSEIESLVSERVRRQEVLYQRGRQIEFYLGEVALYAAPGTLDTLLGQLDRLATLAELNTVRLGVVPFPAMPIMPLCTFTLPDDVVVLETLTGEQRISDPDEVGIYLRALDSLHEAALFGGAAVALIRRASTRLWQDRPG